MKSSIVALTAAAGSAYAAVTAQQSAYGQCGGQGWTGPTSCVSGYHCQDQNDWYYQCVPGAASTTSTSATKAATTVKVTSTIKPTSTLITKASTKASSTKASTSTKATSTSVVKPASTASSKVSTTPATSVKTSTTSVKTTATSVAAVASSSAAATTGKVQYAGVNIAGFDFGCGTDGTCTTSGVVAPGQSGIDQMTHFVTDDKLNIFRLPVGWQFLTNNVLGGGLDATNGAAYDALVQGCLTAGASKCIIDIHNYARWNGEIVGQSNGAVTDQDLVTIWTALATKYASNTNVVFGVMNEPHDLDMGLWSQTVQKVVKAIRTAAGQDHLILLPGTDYTGAGAFLAQSQPYLSNITNNDGSTTNLIFDVHQYLDSDNSGTNTVCTHNNVVADPNTGAAPAFPSLAAWLRTNNRQAILSETGGSNDSTCLTDVCAELTYLMQNSDVFLGWTGWAAGSFATSYTLSETPSGSAGSFVDQAIVSQCIAGVYNTA